MKKYNPTVTIQWDLMLSIQKPSSTRFPVLLNNSFNWFRVKGRTRFRICMILETGFLGGEGDLLAAVGSSGSIRGLGWLIRRIILGSASATGVQVYLPHINTTQETHSRLFLLLAKQSKSITLPHKISEKIFKI